MAILNVTPDSFSDGGEIGNVDDALRRVESMIADGADMIDVGGESTRPGAEPVPLAEERDRVLGVIEALAGTGVPVSVDTRKPELMREAIAAGASMVNDIGALELAGALEAIGAGEVGVCLMHKQGEPRNMQHNPGYVDVVAEVCDYLSRRVAAAEQAGIARERIVVDPGFGFGKTFEHNLALLNGLGALTTLGVPILVGLSRKAMLGRITGRPASERVHASVAAALLAVDRGAHVVRVHDVLPTREALAVWCALRSTIPRHSENPGQIS